MYLRPAAAAAALLATLAGCASLTESTEQSVLVQTVLDHREIAGVGCVLYNDVGKWFVTTPGRVTLRKSAGPLRIDCAREEKGWAYEKVDSKVNANLWGNLALTAGVGYFVDKNTGAGYDYPSTLTVVMHAAQDKEDGPPPPAGVTLF
ncbi:hypothetical protein [Duganella callida]|uniref:Lipoprotein n=1 Tax=Duganella callida TaxID=2561932 RepID=A0A4Y9SSN8_9BURK|nr:hypothetical protein [Duganella callida]TFW29458.1 hypothetical protein E4L98_03755 [Duganella callida]